MRCNRSTPDFWKNYLRAVTLAGAAGVLLLTGCAVADRMSEPFLSLLTGEELEDVSTDPQYSRAGEMEDYLPLSFDTGFGEPLVVIRYDSPPGSYDQPLGMAIGRALDARPQARFDVVAVAPPPEPGTPAEAHSRHAAINAASIMDSLVRHGVPVEHIGLSAITDATIDAPGEIHIYIQ